jgi:hypothetical protein
MLTFEPEFIYFLAVLQNPHKETGFILNRSEHWFSLRRLGQYWFDVNSTQEKPKHVTDSYLGMLLGQMKQDGYSVFVVRGRYNPVPIGLAPLPPTLSLLLPLLPLPVLLCSLFSLPRSQGTK